MQSFAISFSEPRCARALRVKEHEELSLAFKLLGVRTSRPVIVLVGGAKGLEAQHEIVVREVLRTVAQTAENLGAAMLDGGTESGLIALMGRTYVEGKFNFPLIGVAVERMVRWPDHDNPESRAQLEPHHTHFILTPGRAWGDESRWLAACAHELAQTQPALTILVNGGEISRHDVSFSLQAERPVLVVAGTGRLADELAASLSSPFMHVVAATDTATLSSTIHALLTRS